MSKESYTGWPDLRREHRRALAKRQYVLIAGHEMGSLARRERDQLVVAGMLRMDLSDEQTTRAASAAPAIRRYQSLRPDERAHEAGAGVHQ
jgi:hypothetical protein